MDKIVTEKRRTFSAFVQIDTSRVDFEQPTFVGPDVQGMKPNLLAELQEGIETNVAGLAARPTTSASPT